MDSRDYRTLRRQWDRVPLEHRERATAPDVRSYRATHRLDTPGHPPLYALREGDALLAAEQRRPTPSTIYVSDRAGAWSPWRGYP